MSKSRLDSVHKPQLEKVGFIVYWAICCCFLFLFFSKIPMSCSFSTRKSKSLENIPPLTEFTSYVWVLCGRFGSCVKVTMRSLFQGLCPSCIFWNVGFFATRLDWFCIKTQSVIQINGYCHQVSIGSIFQRSPATGWEEEEAGLRKMH